MWINYFFALNCYGHIIAANMYTISLMILPKLLRCLHHNQIYHTCWLCSLTGCGSIPGYLKCSNELDLEIFPRCWLGWENAGCRRRHPFAKNSKKYPVQSHCHWSVPFTNTYRYSVGTNSTDYLTTDWRNSVDTDRSSERN